MSSLSIVGNRIRAARQQRKLTLDDVARECDMNKSKLSKIENGRQIPNLPTLAILARYLDIGLDELVRGAEGEEHTKYQLTRAADRKVVERDDAIGFRYEHLFSMNFMGGIVESYDLYIEPGSTRRTVQTDGRQVLFLIKGKIKFELNDEILSLEAGDTVQFDGRLPHVPRNQSKSIARCIAFYLLPNKS